MKRFLMMACAWAVALPAARGADSAHSTGSRQASSGQANSPRAEESFSKAVQAADFSAAGLVKLSPDELARLDALVRDYKSGAWLAAGSTHSADSMGSRQPGSGQAGSPQAIREADPSPLRSDEARAAEIRPAALRSEATRAAKAEPAKGSESLLAKAKKILVPAGTPVEVAAIESRIAGDFTGWQGKAVFLLENGQRWQMANPGSYYTPVLKSPAVKISPASLGGFWMTIEGVSQRVKVVSLDAGR